MTNFIAKIVGHLFGPTSYDNVISSLSRMVQRLLELETFQTANEARLGAEAERLDDLSIMAGVEAKRAAQCAEKIKELIL